MVLSAAFIGINASDDIATVSSLYALVFNFTSMYTMSHWSNFFLACSSKGNVSEPAFYLTIMNPLTVTQIELCRVQFPTAMSDTKYLNTSVLEVMISSQTERVCICDLSDLMFPIIFDAC